MSDHCSRSAEAFSGIQERISPKIGIDWYSLGSEIGSIAGHSGYGELERDMPGIDSTVIELLKTQILGLCYFLKLSNKCHEN